MNLLLRLVLLASLTPFAAAAAPCVPGSFPGYSWPSKLKETSAAKKTEIAALEEYAFTLTGEDGDRKGIRTDALVIIKGGELIYERYGRGWDETKPHISWSVAKSVTSALTGVAVHQGVLRLDEPVCNVLKGQSDAVCKMTVRNLLEFGSGLDWQEVYEDGSYQDSSVLAMLFGEGHRDMLGFITGHRTYAEPGVKWRYSTGESTVLAAVAKGALVPRLGKDWAWKGLFDVLGMRGTVFEEDLKQTPLGGSHVFATAKDFARFGYLYLRDGCWDGQRVLPEGWVKSSSTPSAPFIASAMDTEKTPNGWMWWLNKASGPDKVRPWPDAPDDAYSAIGHWGQYVVVVPSHDVVIVRTGDDRDDDGLTLEKMIPLALEVAK